MKNDRNIKPRNTRGMNSRTVKKNEHKVWLALGGLVYWALIFYLVFIV